MAEFLIAFFIILQIPFHLDPSLALRELNVFLKTTLGQFYQVWCFNEYFWPVLACFPFSVISYGQEESNLPINLFKGTLIKMLISDFLASKQNAQGKSC
jgi:hypothetical protein